MGEQHFLPHLWRRTRRAVRAQGSLTAPRPLQAGPGSTSTRPTEAPDAAWPGSSNGVPGSSNGVPGSSNGAPGSSNGVPGSNGAPYSNGKPYSNGVPSQASAQASASQIAGQLAPVQPTVVVNGQEIPPEPDRWGPGPAQALPTGAYQDWQRG